MIILFTEVIKMKKTWEKRFHDFAGSLPDFGFSYPGVPVQCPFIPYGILFYHRSLTTNSPIFLHERYILAYLLEGSVQIQVDKQTFHLTPGQAFVIFPGEIHRLVRDNGGNSLLMASFHLIDERKMLAPLKGTVLEMDSIMKKILFKAVEIFFDCLQKETRYVYLICYHFGDFLERLRIRNAPVFPETFSMTDYYEHGGELFRKISQYIVENPHRRITIEELSRKLNVSASHLRRSFRALLGVSLGRYLRFCRMHLAVGLLRSSDMNIAQIAARCGYDSVSAFSRAFKREEKHYAPLAYRRQIRKETFKAGHFPARAK